MTDWGSWVSSTKDMEKMFSTHVKRWLSRSGRGANMAQNIFSSSLTQSSHRSASQPTQPSQVALGHTARITKDARSHVHEDVDNLPETTRGHLLLFMREEFQSDTLPDTLTYSRSMVITIKTMAGHEESFRLHAHHAHYGGPWFDHVEAEITVRRHGRRGGSTENRVGRCSRLGRFKIPRGCAGAGQWQHFIYVQEIFSDAAENIYNKIHNPADGYRGYVQAEHQEDRKHLKHLMEKQFGVRTLTLERPGEGGRGCFLSPSSCHGVALLQPGHYKPEKRNFNKEPDFYFMVNNTLLLLWR